MISFTLEDVIKYVGLAAIIYFLIKAFANDKISNTHIVFIIICVMVLVIFITKQNTNCQKKIEGYQTVSKNQNIERGYVPDDDHYHYEDDDMRDFKDTLGINKQKYEEIKDEEQNIMKNIRRQQKYNMMYTETNPFNTVPLGKRLYGYTYISVRESV